MTNLELQKRIELEVEKNREKDKLLFSQHKLASMGEMMENIAHQWRQPLMELSSLLMQLEAKIKLKEEITNEELLKNITHSHNITSYMSQTIDDFKNFFASDKEKESFKATQVINLCLSIVGNTIKKSNIKLDIYVKKNPTITALKNEYTQVVINIVINAIKILLNRKINEPKITIIIDENEYYSKVSILDNAGGVKEDIMDKIFEPYFTLDTPKGKGLGLFMSKIIIEKNMEGILEVKNLDEGALFTISIPK